MGAPQGRPAGLPPKQGLYDPRFERDACGFGFVAHVHGCASHEIVRKGLQVLENLSHRGAAGCDPCSGDGAGILVQLPHAFLTSECADAGVRLPDAGAFGVGMVFLPSDEADRRACVAIVEGVLAEDGLALLGWREVPLGAEHIGSVARETMPAIRQFFVGRGDLDDAAFELRLYRARRAMEKRVGASGIVGRGAFYVASLSGRTLVYKGLLNPEQITGFYPDLADDRFASAIALVHSRFSTNTFPTWARAHPYRMVCHNGEINALRGNRNWMHVREGGMLESDAGAEWAELFPIVQDDQSDSACFDNALEFLVRGGRSLPHAMMMMVPEAWEDHAEIDPEVSGFYAYHSLLMEPWDGPAAIAFSDGRLVGAALDRNGLRPARYLVTHDDLVVLASEAGVLPIAPEAVRAKGRLRPGTQLVVDTERGLVLQDEEIKREVAARRPYGAWVAQEQVTLDSLPEGGEPGSVEAVPLLERQKAFGYTEEEVQMILTPMATGGQEPVGSMGTDTPLAVLSDHPQLLFKYFRQLFAQVTNPPIDPIREQLVMSLGIDLGPRLNVLEETPEHARRLRLRQPVLDEAAMRRLRALSEAPFRALTLSTRWPARAGHAGMADALEALCARAAHEVREGHTILILSDRGVDAESVAIPSLLAVSAVHHHLTREHLRTRASLVVETGEAREVGHFALLVGYGAEAVHPYLALETLARRAADGLLGDGIDARTAGEAFVRAVGKGLLKIFSKMGISTLQSYCGAQIFEAIGLDSGLVDRHFAGTASRLGGIGLQEIAEEALRRHAAAFDDPHPFPRLPAGGEYHYRAQGEHHNWGPLAIATLQHATRGGSYETFREFSRIANEEQARFNLRGLLDFVPGEPVPLEEVEPASDIVKRFCTGGMSFGALSREAHETLAIAMNRLGGRSNSGEGGEIPERFGDERNSAIKQIASGRFGVTTEYLVNAVELQIKIAQGAKPGEGGQLPGHKVDEVIAATRHSTPGVSLISPPPHHDIYSIEDLAQLISDLKMVNPEAAISVKLVSEVGVGTIAAGVTKAKADLIVIAGGGGGTGASPLSSIKHAGIPWEIGLAETQQTLVLNDLRGRVRLQADGQMRTGRDVVIAALLGADEFGFGTAPLIVEGCIMMRKCHLNTCPVGIATQDPVLRAKFTGQPEHVVNYFFFVAEEARELMASLGFRTFDEMIGRMDRLRGRPLDHWKGGTLDLSPLFYRAEVGERVAIRCVEAQDHELEGVLDHALIRLAEPALEHREAVQAELEIRNIDRTVGAMLSGRIALRHGAAGLPDDTVRFRFTGAAGQSFGAFLVAGVSLGLEGEANDYLGKGMSGGRIVVTPPPGSSFVPEETTLIGNVALYGATGGEVYLRGLAGERFAVRNSGATAVVEGVGDHGCEYMTGGVVVVLGRTGRNFGAGMSGGVAFILDEEGAFERGCNLGMVELERVEDHDDREMLRYMVQRHAGLTGSLRARRVLDLWHETLPHWVKVIPAEYKRVLRQRGGSPWRGRQGVEEEVLAHG
jgi:glutamate synthase (NADPH) large chain